jgi:hypothetical protein
LPLSAVAGVVRVTVLSVKLVAAAVVEVLGLVAALSS